MRHRASGPHFVCLVCVRGSLENAVRSQYQCNPGRDSCRGALVMLNTIEILVLNAETNVSRTLYT
jgi:hypothetical protein